MPTHSRCEREMGRGEEGRGRGDGGGRTNIVEELIRGILCSWVHFKPTNCIKKKPWLSKFGWCRRNLGSRGVTLLQLLLSECLCWKRERRRRLKEGCIIEERSHSIAAVV